MVRAAAKNFHSVAVVTEPDRYGFLLDELRTPSGELSLDTRRDLAAEAFAHVASYDAAIAAWFSDTEPFPERVTLDLLKVADLTLRREPAPAGRALSRGRRPPAPAVSDRAARRQAALVQQPDRPPGGAHDRVGLPGAVLRDRQAREPLPARRSARRSRTPTNGRSPPTRRSAFGAVIAVNRPVGEALARRMLETKVDLLFAPGLRRRRPRGTERQDVDAGARGPRAAQELTRRAGHAPGARRPPDPGPRPRGRGPLGHAGRDRDRSPASASGTTSCSRGGSRTSCTRTRSCSCKDLATVGHRRRPDEPRRRRPDRRREGGETGPAAPSSPRTRSSRSTTARGSPSAPAWQPSSSPAARFATTRSSPRRTRRAPPWSSPAGATSCTERKPQPAAMRLR